MGWEGWNWVSRRDGVDGMGWVYGWVGFVGCMVVVFLGICQHHCLLVDGHCLFAVCDIGHWCLCNAQTHPHLHTSTHSQGTQYRTLQQQHDSLLAQATSRRGELLHQALTLVNDTATDLNEEEEGYRGDTGDKGDKMQGGMQKLQEKQKQQLYNVGGTSSSKRLGVDMNDNNNDNDNNKDNKKYSTVMSMGRLDQPTAAITTTQPSRKRVLSFNISSLTTTTNPTTTAHHPPPTDSTTSTTLPPSSSSSTSTLPISQPLTARLRLEHALEERQQQVPRLVSVVRAMDEGQVVVVEQGKQLQGARQEAADAVQRIRCVCLGAGGGVCGVGWDGVCGVAVCEGGILCVWGCQGKWTHMTHTLSLSRSHKHTYTHHTHTHTPHTTHTHHTHHTHTHTTHTPHTHTPLLVYWSLSWRRHIRQQQ